MKEDCIVRMGWREGSKHAHRLVQVFERFWVAGSGILVPKIVVQVAGKAIPHTTEGAAIGILRGGGSLAEVGVSGTEARITARGEGPPAPSAARARGALRPL